MRLAMFAIRWRASFIVIAGQTFILRRHVVAVVGRDDAIGPEGLVMVCISSKAAIWAGLCFVPQHKTAYGQVQKI